MTVTTAVKPQVGDQVEIKIFGQVAQDPYGTIFVEGTPGARVYHGPALEPYTTIVKAAVPEPLLVGTVVQNQFGDKYVRLNTSDPKRWRYVPLGPSAVAFETKYTWGELLAANPSGLSVLGAPPVGYKPRDLAKWQTYKSPSGPSVGFKVSAGRLVSDAFVRDLGPSESIQLARDILSVHGHKA